MARASIRQVAAIAGVSTMTVSRVMRGQGSSQFEERVLSAVRELDYVPVRSALQNRHVKTHVLGVLLDDEFVFESPIGQQTFDGLRKAAFANGYDLLMLRPLHQQPLEKQKNQFLDRRCDGFIFVVPYEKPEILELLVQHDFPAVTCYSTDAPHGIATVVPDNRSAIRQGVQLLREHSHRNIAFWSGGVRHSDARERATTYEEAMREAGLEVFSWHFPFDAGEGEEQCQPLIEEIRRHGVTAVLCHNDDRAIALWRAARSQGLKVPDDLSLIGIDDMPDAAAHGLTTFANSFYNIGEQAIHSMLCLLEGGAPETHCQRLPLTLVERGSVAMPHLQITV